MRQVDGSTGRRVEVADPVLVEGMTGILVCDFDNRRLAEGYEDWEAPDTEMVGGGRLYPAL